jgi:hypothetical protein
METRDLTAAVSVAVFLVATAIVVMMWRHRGEGGYSRLSHLLAAFALWLLTIANLYSATAYLWADAHPELLEATRLTMVALRTVVLVLLVALLDYMRKIRYGRRD